MPKRIQRKRVKGWKLPSNAICVTRPGTWGNPYKIGSQYRNPFGGAGGLFTVTIENCIQLFELYAKGMLAADPDWLAPLKGKDLACFCPLSSSCHADVLLELANN